MKKAILVKTVSVALTVILSLMMLPPMTAFAAIRDGATFREAFPDADFRSYLFNTIIGSVGADTVISASHRQTMANTTSLYMSNKGISDLTGIEYFTGLTSLSMRVNNLSKLDLSGNVNLNYLEASYNKLTEINLTNNPNLSTLYLDVNQLEKLDVSGNPNLSYLNLRYNKLTALDVSRNRNIYYLQVQENKLTELDISANTQLRYLYCNYNRMGDDYTTSIIGLGYVSSSWYTNYYFPQSPRFNVSAADAAARRGQYVDVEFKATKNPGIAAYTVGVSYDASILTPVSLVGNSYGTFVGNATPTTATPTTATPTSASPTSSVPSGSMAYAVWTYGGTYRSDGALFTMRFQIKTSAKKGATAQVKIDGGEIINATYQRMGYTTDPATVTVSPPAYGDVNLDKSIDSRDLILLMQYLARLSTLDTEALENADVYPDGVIDAKDILLMQQYLLEPNFYLLGEIPGV